MYVDFLNNTILPFIRTVQISDIVDILIVATAVYYLIKHFRNTRAAQLLKGIAIILFITFLAEWMNLNMISFILESTMQVGLIALIIIFQPELRRGLEHMGRSKFGRWFVQNKEEQTDIAQEVCKAAKNLSHTRTGALIVFERQTVLDDLLTGGTAIGAEVTSELLENIFVPNTPLHDGAVLIRANKIHQASCVLPLSSNKDLSNELGTRHRAGLGISEQSDCISLVVSEETGKISLMQNGDMIRNLSEESLYKLLTKLFTPKEDMTSNMKKNFDFIKSFTIDKRKKQAETDDADTEIQ